MTSVIVGINEKMLNLMPSRNGSLTFESLLIFVFHFTLVKQIFYPPKSKSSFFQLKRGIQDFHTQYVLVPADKAANNVVVV